MSRMAAIGSAMKSWYTKWWIRGSAASGSSPPTVKFATLRSTVTAAKPGGRSGRRCPRRPRSGARTREAMATQRVTVDPHEDGVGVRVEQGGQAVLVGHPLEHPPSRRCAVLEVLQHHPVDLVLAHVVTLEAGTQETARVGHPPPRRRRQGPEVECPQPLALGRVACRAWRCRDARRATSGSARGSPASPRRPRFCRSAVSDTPGGGDGPHHLPELEHPRAGIAPEKHLQQRRARTALAAWR